MTGREFQRVAIYRHKSHQTVIDVRPFGNRQHEAIEFLVFRPRHELFDLGILSLAKPICLWHDAELRLPQPIIDQIVRLKYGPDRIRIDVEPAWSPDFRAGQTR